MTRTNREMVQIFCVSKKKKNNKIDIYRTRPENSHTTVSSFLIIDQPGLDHRETL
ncbi:unnamed protein product [Brassica rapa]|uniref:Uncharacterized protein n=2 Tax=Brassica TaxID=3705 RepID=A0A3P6BQ00_BRACM|nr:unnamed protein product [Brassica napus]CAG7899862.1 unnamed protein product [Brassica rapa]VDD07713.1 unnamed protein product [Brassica rapa]